jgi:hypothetical protein
VGVAVAVAVDVAVAVAVGVAVAVAVDVAVAVAVGVAVAVAVGVAVAVAVDVAVALGVFCGLGGQAPSPFPTPLPRSANWACLSEERVQILVPKTGSFLASCCAFRSLTSYFVFGGTIHSCV